MSLHTLTRIDFQRELVHKQMRESQEYLMGVTAANMLAMGKQILKRVARERERARERG